MLDNWNRIESVVRWTGLSVNSFAISIGLKRGENLYQIKRGNNGVSGELARIITAKYPRVSRAWLLTGEGEMFVDEGVATSISLFDADIETLVAAPAPEGLATSGRLMLPGLEPGDLAARYRGRAMGETIPPGSIVVARRQPEGAAPVPGGDYVVVTPGFTVLRRVRRGEQNGELRLIPLDNENFDEIYIAGSEIGALWQIRTVIINKTV